MSIKMLINQVEKLAHAGDENGHKWDGETLGDIELQQRVSIMLKSVDDLSHIPDRLVTGMVEHLRKCQLSWAKHAAELDFLN